MSRQKVLNQIKNWKLIMIIYTTIQKNPAKVWKYYFVTVNLHPNHCLYFYDWINKIAPAVKTGETAYFWNH